MHSFDVRRACFRLNLQPCHSNHVRDAMKSHNSHSAGRAVASGSGRMASTEVGRWLTDIQ
jgi:hypothetical protein